MLRTATSPMGRRIHSIRLRYNTKHHTQLSHHATNGPMVGQEIDIGIYSNGTLVDYVGDETSVDGRYDTNKLPLPERHHNIRTNVRWRMESILLRPSNTNIRTLRRELRMTRSSDKNSNELGFVGGYTGGLQWT